MIPWNHFGRKNIGYLYAIIHGAKVIYDTDDDNVPLGGLDTDEDDIVEIKTKASTINIYSEYIKGNNIWPRGFPLEHINSEVRSYLHQTPKPNRPSTWPGERDLLLPGVRWCPCVGPAAPGPARPRC